VLAALVQTSRTIMIGDFNDWFWVKSIRRRLGQACPVRTRRTFAAYFPMLRLDRIYVKQHGLIQNAWTDRVARVYSDHLPVIEF
jgi:endonuclease/exonuclease/phosphatase family metal-dependent hydrolase